MNLTHKTWESLQSMYPEAYNFLQKCSVVNEYHELKEELNSSKHMRILRKKLIIDRLQDIEKCLPDIDKTIVM